jgi:hypothetical protein
MGLFEKANDLPGALGRLLYAPDSTRRGRSDLPLLRSVAQAKSRGGGR